MKILMSNEVHKNIESIFEYISYDSIKYANETSNNIYFYIDKLKDFPYIGRYVPEIPDKRYRELIYKSYRIIYSVSEVLNSVYIHFIVHSRRNFKSFYSSYLKNNF